MKFTKKVRDEIISGIMAGTIFVTPFLKYVILNKPKDPTGNKNKENTSAIDNTTPTNNFIINTNKMSAEDYITEIKALGCTYSYEDISIPEIINYSQRCNEEYIFDPSSANDLYNTTIYLSNTIKENSLKYINEHKDFVLGFFTNIGESNRLDKIAAQTILKDTIYDILKSGINKDICLFKNLKYVISYSDSIVSSDTYTKYVEDDNTLIVFPNNIRNNMSNANDSFYDILRYSIQCELNGIRLMACTCQKNKLNFPYETLKDALIYSELYNFKKSEILLNNADTTNESLILALGLFNKNASINNYYNSIFNNDIESFYKFCGVIDNEEDIYKLNRILYAMDIVNGKNNIDSNIISINDITEYDYKVELFSMIVNNMIRYTTDNNKFKLNENLILFNVIKNIIMNDINTNNNDALENLTIINNLYIEFLSKHYEISIDKIKEKEVSDDIINYVLGVLEVCNQNDDINISSKYILYSYDLVNKFPLLKQILSTTMFKPLEYQNTINDDDIVLSNNNTLVKKK